ncbi:hypothetical protein J8F10_24245 [Gemmata sp. G18]|uniref:Uncharacterized protein n=1 Tax=Gemmata palustris TaxID=2822762 RepID=A0ABS5BXA7_9BACT|nr:hypothetical protein [Gemmata palustris]MBP3958372.1 hypothetical protein [Gemmata palustris]
MSKQQTIVEWKRIGGKLVRVETRRRKTSSKAQGMDLWGFSFAVTLCITLVSAFALQIKAEERYGVIPQQKSEMSLTEFTQNVLDEHNRSQGIEKNEVAVEVSRSAREAEYGWLADIAECAEKYGPDCWDRIAPKKGGKQ